MSIPASPLIVCTRGSALALAQARQVADAIRTLQPRTTVEIKVVKTTGDRLQTTAGDSAPDAVPRGLFTKELEEELLAGTAQIAVHSLKDVPTDLPEGLMLAATLPRADVREVLLFRGESLRPDPASIEWSPGRRSPFYGKAGGSFQSLPHGAVVATSSPRRAAQIRHQNPGLETVLIRGNVGTRLAKLASQTALDATLLAAAGLSRLRFDISPRGELRVDPRLSATERSAIEPPAQGLLATILEPEEMLPAVGQGAVGLEIRTDDTATAKVCALLNHVNTFASVQAERAFLRAMGGGCQSPVAAYCKVVGHQLFLRAASFQDGEARFAEGRRVPRGAELLGREVAAQLLANPVSVSG